VTVPSPSERILGWLRGAPSPLSGEVLAERLGISRAAVFKHVEALRGRGYAIASEHAQGYVLTATPDRLDETELGPHLTGTWRRIEWHAEIDSTQRRARELGHEGAPEGAVVVAEAQTAGRGRLGRTWHSPAGRNVYASILLRPEVTPSVVPQLALAVGLGAADAIETLGLRPQVKWPNDVLLDGRKAVGILTEMEAELERVRLVVVGIGVNVNLECADLPVYLRETATSLHIAAGRRIDRVAFTAALLASIERTYQRFVREGFAGLRPAWDARDALRGRRVVRDVGGREVAGTVTGVDDDGALRLVDDHGVEQRVVAGEVVTADG
jgi:BirA family transcriptional regulator, biotin operon repressor / biotin---[acetyl-CoA-carboxylase] ligase